MSTRMPYQGASNGVWRTAMVAGYRIARQWIAQRNGTSGQLEGGAERRVADDPGLRTE